MNRKAICIFIPALIFLCMACTGCPQPDPLFETYGENCYYYSALVALEQNDTKSAEKLLKTSIKKSDSFISRRAEEELSTLGSPHDQAQNLLNYYKKHLDEEAVDYAAKRFFQMDDYTNVIRVTEGLDYSTCSSDTAYYRCYSMIVKNDSRFQQEFYQWCTVVPFTQQHQDIFTMAGTGASSDPALSLRSAVFNKNYGKGITCANLVFSEGKAIVPQLASDIGKSLFYGSTNYEENAIFLLEQGPKLPSESQYYAYFYAGRMYSKITDKNSRTQEIFLLAMEIARTDANYDNALWYYLNACLSSTIKEAVVAAEKYCQTWHDPDYFDDFFETLSVRLLSQHMWVDFYRTAFVIDGYASEEVTAKYSYISARLLETGYLKMTGTTQEDITRLYQRSLHSGTNVYYKFMAADKLSLSAEETELYISPERMTPDFEPNIDAENLILAYLAFGYKDRILEAAKKYSSQLGMECTQKLAQYIRSLGSDTNDFYTQSLRMASKKGNNSEIHTNIQMLELMYPRNFQDYVTQVCNDYDLPEYLLYALMRTESFFDPTVISHAGAKGLCQLMDATAGDVAKKLKYTEYDLNDPATNIRFGGYYLSEMLSRLDNSPILALFAYNGGITRVRSWVKNANLEFGTNALPRDLFLESLPYEETRDYGRKVLSSAAMYAYLYYGKTPSEIVKEIMQ